MNIFQNKGKVECVELNAGLSEEKSQQLPVEWVTGKYPGHCWKC